MGWRTRRLTLLRDATPLREWGHSATMVHTDGRSKIVEILKVIRIRFAPLHADLQLYDERPGLRYGGITLIQVAFAAGTIHLMKATRSGPHRRASFTDMTEFDACMSALRTMGLTWKSATQSESILGQLREEWCPQEARPPVSDEQSAAAIGVKALLERNPGMVEELRKLGWAPPSEQPLGLDQSQGYMQVQPPGTSNAVMGVGEGNGLGLSQVDLSGQGGSGFQVSWTQNARQRTDTQDMLISGSPMDGVGDNSFDMPGMSFWETLFAPQNGAAGDGLSFPSAGGDLWSLNGRSG